MLIVESDAAMLPVRLSGHRTPTVDKWIDPATT
jgi:hypothetical protein